jgi:hypothetical protein
MSALVTALRELWGLFVDDGSLALALVLWCAAVGLILPRIGVSGEWSGPILFIGCLVILLGNIALAARRHRSVR